MDWSDFGETDAVAAKLKAVLDGTAPFPDGDVARCARLTSDAGALAEVLEISESDPPLVDPTILTEIEAEAAVEEFPGNHGDGGSGTDQPPSTPTKKMLTTSFSPLEPEASPMLTEPLHRTSGRASPLAVASELMY